jgi:N-acetylglutamate synthase-like GNAT family acetyltransferase
MQIRRAQQEEAAALTQIANDAKRYWGYPEHWLEHWRQDLTIAPEFIADADVYLAEDAGEVLGFYGLVMKREKAELEHMWVAPAHMGRGVGKELFIHAMQRAAGQEVGEVEICADPNAEGFYQRMGASRYGEQVTEIDGTERVLPLLKVDPHQS